MGSGTSLDTPASAGAWSFEPSPPVKPAAHQLGAPTEATETSIAASRPGRRLDRGDAGEPLDLVEAIAGDPRDHGCGEDLLLEDLSPTPLDLSDDDARGRRRSRQPRPRGSATASSKAPSLSMAARSLRGGDLPGAPPRGLGGPLDRDPARASSAKPGESAAAIRACSRRITRTRTFPSSIARARSTPRSRMVSASGSGAGSTVAAGSLPRATPPQMAVSAIAPRTA